MDKKFERITSTQRAITLLMKFEKLKLPNLPIQEKYQRILSQYGKDIEMVSKNYQKNKNEPPVARDLPPIAGNFTLGLILLYRFESKPE
jgi:dynein heavy chain